MPTLDSLFSPRELSAAIDAGHVTRTRHPGLGLSLYAYTRLCQYEHAWSEVTRRCRGLVVSDGDGAVVAWPLRKFFNTVDHARGLPYAPPLPTGPFRIYDKVDGSLGLVFFWRGQWRVVTTGAFDSLQARWAQCHLSYRDTSALVPGITYIAEIVYPDNRVVVDYRGRQDLVLLAVHGADGTELDLDAVADHWAGVGTVVRQWPAMPLDQLLQLTRADTRPDGSAARGIDGEGFVVLFANGLRMKVKYAEYQRLHRALGGVTVRDLWRAKGLSLFAQHDVTQLSKALDLPRSEIAARLAGGDPLTVLLRRVPDEYDEWVHGVLDGFTRRAESIQQEIDAAFRAHAHLAGDRRAFARALSATESAVRSGAFQRLDGNDTSLLVWHALKPRTD